MATITVKGGLASEYDDQILWIEEAAEGAKAALIVDETEYTPCTVTKVLDREDFDSEEAYSDACDELNDESTALCTGEFISAEGVFYVELEEAGETEYADSIEFDDVDFC